VETIRRRSVEERRTLGSLVAEFGISMSTYQNWKRALELSSAGPTTFRPVEVTALVPTFTPTTTSALTLVTKSGHRIEGLSLEQAAQLVRALEC
jgi:hypothetical protein